MSKKPEGMTEINGYVPKELKREFKTVCTSKEVSMGEVLTALIEGWLGKKDYPPKAQEESTDSE
jgi:hypothetical protein